LLPKFVVRSYDHGAIWSEMKEVHSGGGADLSPKFPPALRGVLGIKSLALGRHLVHRFSLQKFHRCQVTQC
jgi:hypothetical protein